jgi:beta-aspartyl-peptidase (threonine type)
VLVVGSGVERLARQAHLPLCDPTELIIPRERERWQRVQADPKLSAGAEFRSHDTVGALALDHAGDLAAAISTGGTLNKLPGRVGDAPLVGCGFYADNQRGACCSTGMGEAIMRRGAGEVRGRSPASG